MPIVMWWVYKIARPFCYIKKEDATFKEEPHATLFVHVIDVEEALKHVMPGIVSNFPHVEPVQVIVVKKFPESQLWNKPLTDVIL